ncbi:transporter substrate-binding domain-containing protein [bacterium]|nr:transporter substrate-binding domain-containing protein [bacterium]
MSKKILFSLFFFLQISTLKADNIVIVADQWCPYNCEPNSKNEGYLIEIIREIFEAKGHSIQYNIVPWARAIVLGRYGKIDAIIGAFKEDAPDFIFPQIEQGISKNAFCVSEDSKWTYNSIESLESVKLGVSKGYSYGAKLDSYIKTNGSITSRIFVLTGDTPLNSGLKLLSRGRINTLIEDESVIQYQLSNQNLFKSFKIVKTKEATQLFLAFSPKLAKSKEYAKIMDQGMEELRQSGRFDQILSKYGLNDWIDKDQL